LSFDLKGIAGIKYEQYFFHIMKQATPANRAPTKNIFYKIPKINPQILLHNTITKGGAEFQIT